MLPRVFLDELGHIGTEFVVSGEDGRHFAKSLRVAPGEPLVTAMTNGPWLAEVVEVSGTDVRVRVSGEWRRSEPTVQITVVQGVAKGDKMESIVQKCTEIGVSSFIAYDAERSVSRIGTKVDGKLQRWSKVIREASMQSQRDIVPDVAYAADLPAVFRLLATQGVERLFVLDENEHRTGLKTACKALATTPPQRVAVFVGPEGGLGDKERNGLEASDSVVMVTMGPRILRTETAGATAAAMILSEYGDMGG